MEAAIGSQRGSHLGERLPTPNGRVRLVGGDHASSRADPDNAERLTGIYGVRSLGFAREMASKWHVPRGDEEALVTQPD
jgi:hypothetical protein